MDLRVATVLLFAGSLLIAATMAAMWGFAPVAIVFAVTALVISLSTMWGGDYYA